MRISFSIFGLLFLVSCATKQAENEIIIRGQVQDIPDGKVYLTNAYRWMIELDSTTVKDGNFLFKITPDSSFYPYLASIRFPDANSSLGRGALTFPGGAFYLEKGTTFITSDTTKSFRVPTGGLIIPAKAKAGKQNVAFIDNSMSDFGWLGIIDSAKRESRIRYFHNQIKKYPFSYFLLDGIFNSRNQYTKNELENLLVGFNEDVRQSALGQKFRKYLFNRRDLNKPYPNLSLIASENKRRNILDATADINMLVFWASWCGPCRKEIPSLKQIYHKYQDQKLNLVSISVDEKSVEWRKAVDEEKMPWPQLLVGKEEFEFVDAQFDPTSIPLIIFTDQKGNELSRFVGYENGQEKKYDSIINRHLLKK